MAENYFNSEPVELMRSQVHPADYNPRQISDEGRKALKRSIKRYGVVGGIVVNKSTGYTIVGGHQKVSILDELKKYDEQTHENDYPLRVELIDVDEKTEKSLNVALNNPNVGGQWDFDKMRELIPDIDYKDAGLTEADLSMIGLDYLYKTEEESNISSEIDDMMEEVNQQHSAQIEQRKMERQAEKQAEYERNKQTMKDVKADVKEKAVQQAMNMDAYLMLSFDTWEAKASFCQRLGYPVDIKFVKGEEVNEKIEIIID